MLQMNGYERRRSLRQEPWGLRMLLVAVTGWDKRKTSGRPERPVSITI